MWVAVIADAKGMLKGCSEIQVDLVETVILRRKALTEKIQDIYNSDIDLTDHEKKYASAIEDRATLPHGSARDQSASRPS
ncbi:hypothetical protein MUP00_07850, partial [Candidatus Bathyarchaeota archaeon]|nr:hypothetical protein [Candidatus Bathyarchaeota archaeon]